MATIRPPDDPLPHRASMRAVARHPLGDPPVIETVAKSGTRLSIDFGYARWLATP
ncbi:hypothetical protein Pa4123_38350 [Phytohabitans aurantiacus]|uniref:Uncharacterized protein n=2 Tax=Phytohabitans aurantiacus TaxID=3016789 RepID=A0ABQ5QVF7_9ACTN|nr:hypothetical protein Pa4123_38350 [Phytohabitans aurantiacus]